MDWYLEQTMEHERERLRGAHKAWLIQQALAAAASEQSGWRDQALVRLGSWLVTLGRRLELSGGCAAAPMMTSEAADRR
jgi:hypothetical protein